MISVPWTWFVVAWSWYQLYHAEAKESSHHNNIASHYSDTYPTPIKQDFEDLFVFGAESKSLHVFWWTFPKLLESLLCFALICTGCELPVELSNLASCWTFLHSCCHSKEARLLVSGALSDTLAELQVADASCGRCDPSRYIYCLQNGKRQCVLNNFGKCCSVLNLWPMYSHTAKALQTFKILQ